MTPTIFARVLEWYDRLNPERKPAILFAPGVKESIWFAEQFTAAGITAAHIDGDMITFGETDGSDPVTMPSTRELREQIMAGSRDGSIKVLCNRFVLREGWDVPLACAWNLRHRLWRTFKLLASRRSAAPCLPRTRPRDGSGPWRQLVAPAVRSTRIAFGI